MKITEDRRQQTARSAPAAQGAEPRSSVETPLAVAQSPRVTAQRQVLGKLQAHFPAASYAPAKATGRRPAQRFKDEYPAKREGAHSEWKGAAPFQLATVQFDAVYDIKAYGEDLKAYARRCQEAQTIPVIDFRYYDAAFKSSIDAYHLSVRKQLQPVLETEVFDITFSLLRDETMEPAQVDRDFAKPQTERLQETLKRVPDLDMEKDAPSRGKFAQGNATEKKSKKAALTMPVTKMLSGDMMVPVPEALNLLTMPKEALNQAFEGKDPDHRSAHHRLFARALYNAPQQEQQTEVATSSAHIEPQSETKSEASIEDNGQEQSQAERKPLRLRSNSSVTPDTLTLTNLVTGSEQDNIEATKRACAAAFAKGEGASQVLLIIEEVVDKSSGKTRPVLQIEALQEVGYTVEVLVKAGLTELGPAEQSGVKLAEPTKPPPARWKVRVTRKEK